MADQASVPIKTENGDMNVQTTPEIEQQLPHNVPAGEDTHMHEVPKDEPINHDLGNEPETDGDSCDYYALLEQLQKQFSESYGKSIELYEAEQAQRQTMYFYQRRNNAVLEVLNDMQGEVDADIMSRTSNRIENIIQMNPHLRQVLEPLVNENATLSNAHKLNMYMHEGIPEIPHEGLEHYERNPQDLEPWACRHIPRVSNSKSRKRIAPHK